MVTSDDDRVQPPAGSEPDGPGFGRPWVPQPGVTFLADGSFIRSLVDISRGPGLPMGLVGMDVPGRWNKGAPDTLSILCKPEIAEEWGQALIDAARAARQDERAYRG